MVAQTQSVIKIKRSTTAGAPGTTLSAGELAYSGLAGTQSNGGDRLYIGINSIQSVIGGKYFTDMMSHTGGILQTSFVSALLTDAFGKIDQVKTTNLTFGGASGAGYDNSIRSTGELYLEPGSGNKVHISGAYYLPNVDGSADYVLTSHADGTTSWELPATNLTVAGDIGSDVVIDLLHDTLTIEGEDVSGVDTTTNPSLNKIVISMRNASDTQKGVATFKNTDFTVLNGDVELAVNVPQEFTADSGGTLTLTGNSLLIEGDPTRGVETSTGPNKIHIKNTIATSSQLGVARFSTSYFSIDGGGEVTSTLATASADGVAHFPTSNFNISNGEVTIKLATDTQVGVAKFDSTNFTVSGAGKVTSNAFYLGGTILNLGDAVNTNTDLSGMITIEVGNLKFQDSAIKSVLSNSNIELSPNGSGNVKVSSYTLPNSSGSDGYALITNGSNAAAWTEIGKSLNISDDTNQTGNVNFLTEILAFHGDISGNAGAISTTVNDTTGFPSITIAARTANNTRTGIASFSSDSFDVSAGGAVTVKALGITNAQLVNDSITFGTSEYFLGGSGANNAVGGPNYDFVGMDYAEFSNIVIGLSADTNITGSDANTIRATTNNLKLVAAGAVQINNSYNSFTLPTSRGSDKQVLTTDGLGGTSWNTISTNLKIAGDTSADDFNLISDTLTFVGDSANGLHVEVSDGSYVTYTMDDAATGAGSAQKGTASFESVDFGANAGHITLSNTVVKKVKADTGTDVETSAHALSILGTSARGITTAATANTITVSADYAGYNTGAHLGVASFDDVGFTVTNGAVTANTIFLGTTELALGDATGTNPTIAGLTQVDINNVRITGNTISSTDADGNIVLDPNGAGVVNVSDSRITNVSTPIDGKDAVNKSYADALVSGLDVKNSVRVISKSPISLSGTTQPIDGVSVVANDRVLVAGQTDATQNGIYDVKSGAWVRSADADNSPVGEVTSGLFTFVEEGTTWANSGFILVTANPITLGTTALVFTQFSAAGQTIAGDGLTKSGDAINVVPAAGGGIQVNADSIELASTLAGDGLTYTSGVLKITGTADRITVDTHTVNIANTYVGQDTITTLGSTLSGHPVTTGTWNADTVMEIYGGTGQSTYAKGDLLYASDANVLSKLAAGSNAYKFLMQDTAGLPVWADIDGGTY